VVFESLTHKYSHLNLLKTEAYINPTYATNFLHVDQKQKTKKMVYNVSFIDHVMRMVGRPLRLYWMVFVRKDFGLHG